MGYRERRHEKEVSEGETNVQKLSGEGRQEKTAKKKKGCGNQQKRHISS